VKRFVTALFDIFLNFNKDLGSLVTNQITPSLETVASDEQAKNQAQTKRPKWSLGFS